MPPKRAQKRKLVSKEELQGCGGEPSSSKKCGAKVELN